jgi:hypothetical protein
MKYLYWFLVVFLLVTSIVFHEPKEAGASVSQGGEMFATSTGATYGIPAVKTLRDVKADERGAAVLGSIIVTEAGAAGGHTNFYNATTSNITLRAASMATSSILVASVPNNLGVGTYVIDAVLNNGLLVVFDGGGTQATSTITYR